MANHHDGHSLPYNPYNVLLSQQENRPRRPLNDERPAMLVRLDIVVLRVTQFDLKPLTVGWLNGNMLFLSHEEASPVNR